MLVEDYGILWMLWTFSNIQVFLNIQLALPKVICVIPGTWLRC